MSLTGYGRLFPSQDLFPADGEGNLIAAPLLRSARADGRPSSWICRHCNRTRTGAVPVIGILGEPGRVVITGQARREGVMAALAQLPLDQVPVTIRHPRRESARKWPPSSPPLDLLPMTRTCRRRANHRLSVPWKGWPRSIGSSHAS